MRRYFLFIIFLGLSLFFSTAFVRAQEERVNVYFFWSKTCPYCKQEKVFLESLAKKYDYVEIKDFEISNPESIKLLKEVSKNLQIDISSIPLTIIGKYHFSGFYSEEVTGKEIIKAIECNHQGGCEDVVAPLIKSEETTVSKKPQSIPEEIKIPLVGGIRLRELSLPVLTFIIALLDGFNPCAMWVLLFLISLLLGMKEKLKMWSLGIAFIFASGLVYFLFLSAWLNFFLLLGFVGWVRIIIGLVALGSGAYQLRDYFVNKEGGCEVVDDKKRVRIFEKLKKITTQKKFILSLLGVVFLAFGVNLVELVCSAGLPAIYTQILSLAALPKWQYYLYLLFYILIFMLDDLLVFVVAMITLKATGIEHKYARFSRLIGGILISIIGVLLLLKPEILMFG